MKKLLALVLVACMILAVGAFSAFADEGDLVGLSMPTKSLERWNRDGTYLKEQFEAAGYKVELTYSDNDAVKQNNDIANMIADGVKVLVVVAIDADSLFLNPFLYKKGDNKVYFLSNVKSGNSDEILSNLKKMSAGACGFSKVHCDIAEIREALSEAAADLSCRFYNSSLTQKQEEDLMLNDFYLSIINIHIKENRISSACIDLQNYLEKAAEVKFAAETVYDLCNEVLSKLQTTVNPIEQYSPETLYRSDGYENLCNYVFSLIRQIRNAHTTYTKSIQKALDYIDEHFAEDISLNSVADHVYLHRDYLSRQFKKEVGINFVDYLMNVRLNRAKTLLESTGMRVSDIAVQVGIPNLSYFSTVFSRKFGVSPNAVRSHRITNF